MSNPPPAPSIRCVIFMTERCASDIPSAGHGTPAALLPLGAWTLAEKVIESCAEAGFQDIDVVTSHAPEQLRHVLENGWRWGVRLNWHTVQDAAAPYRILRSLDLRGTGRLIIGHADRWIATTVLRELARADQPALCAVDASWTGWISMADVLVNAIPPNCNYEACERVALAMHGRVTFADSSQYASARTPRELLASQLGRLSKAPPTWRHEVWGAASPLAHVDPQAEIIGPALIGPGVVIERGARIGPNALICADSVVARGSAVRDTIVLPGTWVGRDLQLDHGIAQGDRWYNLPLASTLSGKHTGGVLTDLRGCRPQAASVLGQLAAAAAAFALLPVWFTARAAMGKSATGLGGWRVLQAVSGRCETTGAVREQAVRLAPSRSLGGRIIGLQGGLLDIAQGRRSWIGVRPRNQAQWSELPLEWQVLFATQLVGLFHATAWDEQSLGGDRTTEAAADAFLSVLRAAGRTEATAPARATLTLG